MKVETYEIENSNQPEASTMAQDAEAAELITKLGLKGQAKLLNPETVTRNPYRVMTKEEQIVYGALLTQHTKLEDYSDDSIPVRVLQVAAHAKECTLFYDLEVWHAEPAVFTDDPVLVGRIKLAEYSFRLHILARWGRELLNLEQMEAIAIKFLRPKRIQEAEGVLSEIKTRLEMVTNTTSLSELSKAAHFYIS